MKFNLRLLFPCFVMTILFLSGCGPKSAPNSLTVDLVSPQTSIVIWPQSPYILAAQAHTQGSANESVHITFYANQQMIGAVDSSTESQAVLKWTPPALGTYTIQAEAQAGSASASSTAVEMCILNIDTSHGFPLWGYGYNGPCTLPPASASQDPVTVSAMAKPDSLSYSYNCPSSAGPAVIYFQAKVSDPGNRVAFVSVKYMCVNYALNSSSVFDGASSNNLYDSVMLNETSVASDGTKIFTGSTQDLGPISSALLSGATAGIQWWARAMSSNGSGADQVLTQDGPYTVPIGPCTPPAITPTP
ncbi:MAG: hypothetical protein WBW94_08770 [Anaerolineales bacterium]